MPRNLRLRHRVAKATRDFLDEHGFLEIETPILSKSHAGRRARLPRPEPADPGQVLRAAAVAAAVQADAHGRGLEKYFQIARCFRDEDLRADRQPEFTQIDIEASFIAREDIYALIEGLARARSFKAARGMDIPTPFPRMTFARGDEPLRHRQAGHALRHGARRI